MFTIPRLPRSAASNSGSIPEAAGYGPRLGRQMIRSHDYQIISDTAPEIETALAAQSAEGWRPILMSTAIVASGQVHVFIILEKSIPAPYAK